MEWIKDNRRMLTFFTVVLASVSLNLYLYRSSQSSYEASHEMIVRQYNAQILKSVKAINGVTKYVPAKNSTRSDSLYADLQAQYLQVLEDQKLFQESVKSMLELEFSKILSVIIIVLYLDLFLVILNVGLAILYIFLTIYRKRILNCRWIQRLLQNFYSIMSVSLMVNLETNS